MTLPARTPLGRRLGMMLTGWGTVGLCYSIGRLAPGHAHVLHETALDRLVPFDPSAIWLYLSFFVFVPVAYLCAPPSRLKPLLRSMQLCAIASVMVFVLWPTTLVYPPIPSGAAGSAVLQALAGSDSTQNCLPSLHGALTVLCVFALWRPERPLCSAVTLLWGLAIMWSVVQARRHLAIDLGAGVALGAACAWLGARFGNRSRAVSTHEVPAAGPADTTSFNPTVETRS
jgi:hypothetical protein